MTLTSVSDAGLGDELTVAWEVEPGREVLPANRLPEVTAGGLDDPDRLGAFLDAVRWGTVANADARTLQAPFGSGSVRGTVRDSPAEPSLTLDVTDGLRCALGVLRSLRDEETEAVWRRQRPASAMRTPSGSPCGSS